MKPFYVHGQGLGPHSQRVIDTIVTAESREQAIVDVMDEYEALGWTALHLRAEEQPILYPANHASRGVA